MEFMPRYTFSFCIKKDGKVLVGTEVGAGDSQEEITRAKKTIQRLLNEYNPAAKHPEKKPEPQKPVADTLPEVTAPPPHSGSDAART